MLLVTGIEDEGELDGENPSDKLRDLMLMSGDEESPVVLPFEGFRERIQAEKAKTNDIDDVKDKKSLDLSKNEANVFPDEERIGAHLRKHKVKPPPYTAEYLTSNRLVESPLDVEVRTNAMRNYIQTFKGKHFPFEYENPGEPRIYYEEGVGEALPMDVGSEENFYPFQEKGKSNLWRIVFL